MPRKVRVDGHARQRETEMARFEMADIECASFGEAPAGADSFFVLGMMYSVGRSVPSIW